MGDQPLRTADSLLSDRAETLRFWLTVLGVSLIGQALMWGVIGWTHLMLQLPGFFSIGILTGGLWLLLRWTIRWCVGWEQYDRDMDDWLDQHGNVSAVLCDQPYPDGSPRVLTAPRPPSVLTGWGPRPAGTPTVIETKLAEDGSTSTMREDSACLVRQVVVIGVAALLTVLGVSLLLPPVLAFVLIVPQMLAWEARHLISFRRYHLALVAWEHRHGPAHAGESAPNGPTDDRAPQRPMLRNTWCWWRSGAR